MMINSTTNNSLKLEWGQGNEIILTKKDATGWEGETIRRFKALASDVQKMKALVKRENMGNWDGLKEIRQPEFQVMDYSSGASLALVFADPDNTLSGTDYRSFGTAAARQHGARAAIEEVLAILNGCCREENLLSEEKNPPKTNFLGMMGMNINTPTVGKPGLDGSKTQRPIGLDKAGTEKGHAGVQRDGSWYCPNCGHKNEGRFCSECGSARPN